MEPDPDPADQDAYADQLDWLRGLSTDEKHELDYSLCVSPLVVEQGPHEGCGFAFPVRMQSVNTSQSSLQGDTMSVGESYTPEPDGTLDASSLLLLECPDDLLDGIHLSRPPVAHCCCCHRLRREASDRAAGPSGLTTHSHSGASSPSPHDPPTAHDFRSGAGVASIVPFFDLAGGDSDSEHSFSAGLAVTAYAPPRLTVQVPSERGARRPEDACPAVHRSRPLSAPTAHTVRGPDSRCRRRKREESSDDDYADDEDDDRAEGGPTKPRRKASEHCRNILMDWLVEHQEHPYPTKREKEELARRTGMDLKQVMHWMSNVRKRRFLPLISGRRLAESTVDVKFLDEFHERSKR